MIFWTNEKAIFPISDQPAAEAVETHVGKPCESLSYQKQVDTNEAESTRRDLIT